jgi:hypothetical protein
MFRRFLTSALKGPLESIPKDCREYHPIDLLKAAQKTLTRLQRENLMLRRQLKREQDRMKIMQEKTRLQSLT